MASRPRGKLGCFGALVFAAMLVVVITALLAPWAFHIGNRWTPGFWEGVGELHTDTGVEYPLYIYFYPNFRSMSHLRLNGQRPTSGLKGTGWLCSARGEKQLLDLTGDIYGTYVSTDGNQVGIRLLDFRQPFELNAQNRRYVDFYGRWHGGELVMQDDGGWERGFRPDAHSPKGRATVTFNWGSYSDFEKLCEAASIPERDRIAPLSK